MCFLNNSQCFNNIIYGLVLVRLHEYHVFFFSGLDQELIWGLNQAYLSYHVAISSNLNIKSSICQPIYSCSVGDSNISGFPRILRILIVF